MAQLGLHSCLAKISWKVCGCKEQEDTSLQSDHEGLVRKDRQTQPWNGSNNEDREALASSIWIMPVPNRRFLALVLATFGLSLTLYGVAVDASTVISCPPLPQGAICQAELVKEI